MESGLVQSRVLHGKSWVLQMPYRFPVKQQQYKLIHFISVNGLHALHLYSSYTHGKSWCSSVLIHCDCRLGTLDSSNLVAPLPEFTCKNRHLKCISHFSQKYYILCHFIYMYTAAQKFGISKIFNVFLMESLMLIEAAFLWSTNTEKTVILWNITAVGNIGFLSNVIYFCDQSCIFSIITAVFSVAWSSEISIIFWYIISVKTIVLLNIFLEPDMFLFDSLMNYK